MKISCPICFEAYSDKELTPRIVPFCGHTFCIKCIKNMLPEGEPETRKFKCAMCRKESQGPIKDAAELEALCYPNYAIIQQIDENKAKSAVVEMCPAHKNIIVVICLNQLCKKPGKCCMTCVEQDHATCEHKDLLPRNEIAKRIPIVDYSHANDHFIKDIENSVNQFKLDFDKMSSNFVGEYKANLIKYRLSANQLNPKDAQFNVNLFKSMIQSDGKMAVAPYNYDEFESFGNNSELFKQLLERSKNEHQDKFNKFMAVCFAKLSTAKQNCDSAISTK
jgi:hypothetical protein